MRNSFVVLCLISLSPGCSFDDEPPQRPVFSSVEPRDEKPNPTSPSPAVADSPSPAPKAEVPQDSAEPESPRLADAELSTALAAFQGKTPEAKALSIYGHTWNIKPARVVKEATTVIVEGQISHAIRLSPDDQIFYKITFEGELVKSFDIKYSNLNWLALTQVALPMVSTSVSLPFSTELVGNLLQGLDELLYRDWQEQAKVLILELATASRS